MGNNRPSSDYVTAAQGRAKLRGLWGFTCALLGWLLAITAWVLLLVTLLDWHLQLHHPERVGVFPRQMEFWEIAPLLTILSLLPIGGLILNTVIWLIPPLRQLSERPARIDPQLGFLPSQRKLLQFALWTSWTFPLAILAAWLAP